MAKESFKSREERSKSSTSAHAFEKATGFYQKIPELAFKA